MNYLTTSFVFIRKYKNENFYSSPQLYELIHYLSDTFLKIPYENFQNKLYDALDEQKNSFLIQSVFDSSLEPSYKGKLSVFYKYYLDEIYLRIKVLYNRYVIINFNKLDILPSIDAILISIEFIINKFVDYLTDLVDFYEQYKALRYFLDWYPSQSIVKRFISKIKLKGSVVYINVDGQLLIIKMIDEITRSRFLSISSDMKSCSRKDINKLSSSSKASVKKVCNTIYARLSRYSGIACPDHLPFISLISTEKAREITNCVIKYKIIDKSYFDEFLSILRGKRNFYLESQSEFENRLLKSNILVVNSRKLGMLTFMLNYLIDENYLLSDFKGRWKRLAESHIFLKKTEGILQPVSRDKFKDAYSDTNKNFYKSEINDTIWNFHSDLRKITV